MADKKIKNKKELRRFKIKKRIRKVVVGSAERPRMTVYRSNKEMYVQLIDDLTGTALSSVSTQDKDLKEAPGTKSEKAGLLGKAIALKAKEAGIEVVVFDRNGYLYHGRVKALANAARENGLKF